jgi:aconitate hydratase
MTAVGNNSLSTRSELKVGDRTYQYYSLAKAAAALGDVSRLPFSMKVLLENLIRFEDGVTVTRADIEAVVAWQENKGTGVSHEIQYRPARVLMQDFTGVPAVVDLAALRDAMKALGGDPARINPQVPVHLVIDHSVMVDEFGSPKAFEKNVAFEYERNYERYQFLKWGASAFDNFSVVPPGTGICHQVNLEAIARAVWSSQDASGAEVAYPDTLVGTDSHTTMVNGLGRARLGRRRDRGGSGDARPAGLDADPGSGRLPPDGRLKEGITATDLVLTVTQMLRKKGVVGRFVEFYGPGVSALSLADRATIANMAPEYGATCGFFPVDGKDARLSPADGPLGGADRARRGLCQGAGHVAGAGRGGAGLHRYAGARHVERRAVARGPKRPQDKVRCQRSTRSSAPISRRIRPPAKSSRALPGRGAAAARRHGGFTAHDLGHGDVVIAAITSCTNTSNPPCWSRRAGGAEGAGEGAREQALGEDLARARGARW